MLKKEARKEVEKMKKIQLLMDELELLRGSILINLGEINTEVTIVYDNKVIYEFSIDKGEKDAINDIRLVLNISNDKASSIKKEHGCYWNKLLKDNDAKIEISSIKGFENYVSSSDISEIMQARMEDILVDIKNHIAHVEIKELSNLSGNIILTGSETLVPGVLEVAKSVFQTTSVRISNIQN